MINTTIHIFNSDRFELKMIADTPSLYIMHKEGTATPIHFSELRDMSRLKHILELGIEMWKNKKQLPPEVQSDEIPF